MFEANPIPARDSEGSNKPCAHQDPEIPQRLNQTVFECLLRRYRSAVDCCRNRGSECSRPRNGISFLEEVAINPTMEHPNLNRTLGGHKQNLVCNRIREKGIATPQEANPDLRMSIQKSPVEAWVSNGLLQVWGH